MGTGQWFVVHSVDDSDDFRTDVSDASAKRAEHGALDITCDVDGRLD